MSKKKIIVLGSGLVGSVIARDLHRMHDVIAADASKEVLSKLEKEGLQTLLLNIDDESALQAAIKDVDLVIGAVPGFMGYRTAERVIRAGKNMVDISFFPEDAFGLDALAKEKGVTIVTDCGVAPGMGNIILGYHDARAKVKSYECLVGGLPVIRQWPWEYKAVFSPIDVIEEYTRPARYVLGGNVIVREALSEAELIEFPGVGTLESWNSDGLRSLIYTMPHIPDMIEKTLRYPGCIEYLKVLRHAGFFSQEKINVKGQDIRPVDLTAALLFPEWKLKPGEEDFTIMRIVIDEEEGSKTKRTTWHLLDRYDRENNIISMARTTGYTCTAVAELVLNGKFKQPGINPPEFVGRVNGCMNEVLEYLRQRNVIYQSSEIIID